MTPRSSHPRWSWLAAAALIPISTLGAYALPASPSAKPATAGPGGPCGWSPPARGPRFLLTQNGGLGPGFGQGPAFDVNPALSLRSGGGQSLAQQGFGQGFGQGVGQGFGQGLGQGFGQIGGTGRQGGTFPGGTNFSLAPGQTSKMLAFCTDLLADPPDGTTRFRGGKGAQVAFADGTSVSLEQALSSKLVALNGKNDTFDPIRRAGSLALDLYLTNTSGMPARVVVPAGTAVAPENGKEQPLPAGAERLFALAKTRYLTYSNTMQFAVWAARGSTAEEVEQTQMVRLSSAEIGRVQDLLDQSGIRQTFDRNRGLYGDKYEAGVEALGEKSEPIAGTATLSTGTKAEIAGVRGPDDKGYVTIKPVKKGGEFFYQAEFENRKDGRVSVKLIHLATGRPARASHGRLLLTPGA